MKSKHQSGFAHVGLLLLVATVIAAIGGSGYYVYHKNHQKKPSTIQSQTNVSDEYKEGVITIKQVSKIGEASKQAMLAKVIRPFVDYQDNELKLPVTNVVVTISKNPTTGQPDSKFGYDLSYNQKGSSIVLGFTFGDSGKIDYWIPQLCDDGGCRPYPDSFKNKYPQNYQAYLNSQQKYLVIKEWGVKIPLSVTDSGAYYKVSADIKQSATNPTNLVVYSTQSDNITGPAGVSCKGEYVAYLLRLPANDPKWQPSENVLDGNVSPLYFERKVVGAYKYAIATHKEYGPACWEATKANTYTADQATSQKFENVVSAFTADFKSIVSD
jgi:hypothetical protein